MSILRRERELMLASASIETMAPHIQRGEPRRAKVLIKDRDFSGPNWREEVKAVVREANAALEKMEPNGLDD